MRCRMIPIPDSVAAAVKLTDSEAVERYAEKISQDLWRNINLEALEKLSFERGFFRSNLPGTYWKKPKVNPLKNDKHGLFKEYMRAFNDTSDVVEYEKPNKYNFKLVSL